METIALCTIALRKGIQCWPQNLLQLLHFVQYRYVGQLHWFHVECRYSDQNSLHLCRRLPQVKLKALNALLLIGTIRPVHVVHETLHHQEAPFLWKESQWGHTRTPWGAVGSALMLHQRSLQAYAAMVDQKDQCHSKVKQIGSHPATPTPPTTPNKKNKRKEKKEKKKKE